jgi:hypothetical protein
MGKKAMTTSAAGRIQGAEARGNGGQVKSGGFAARAQAAAAGNKGGAAKAPSPGAAPKGTKK